MIDFSLEILSFLLETPGISNICDNRIPYIQQKFDIYAELVQNDSLFHC